MFLLPLLPLSLALAATPYNPLFDNHRFRASQPDPGLIRFEDGHNHLDDGGGGRGGGGSEIKKVRTTPSYTKVFNPNNSSSYVYPELSSTALPAPAPTQPTPKTSIHRRAPAPDLKESSSSSLENVARSGLFGQHHCPTLTSFNPSCCSLGYTNCCGGGGGGGGWVPHRPYAPLPPSIIAPILPPVVGGGWKGQSHHVAPLPPIYKPHPHPHPPRPRPPPPPILIPHPRPPPAYGWLPPHHKPGSCPPTSPFSFLSKLNIFKGIGHGWGKGWQPHYPPSQNAGYHFYRRSGESNNHNNQGQLELEQLTPQLTPTSRFLGGIATTSGWGASGGSYPCELDYQCPGVQKCCHGQCKNPNHPY